MSTNRKRSRAQMGIREVEIGNEAEGVDFKQIQRSHATANERLTENFVVKRLLNDSSNSSIGESKIIELETAFAGSNGNNGAMFDVSTKSGRSIIEIVSLDIHTNLIEKDCPIVVYGRKGTHLGFENATESWTLLANTTTECNGFGSRTEVPVFVDPPVIGGGESYSFYVYMPSPSIRYINGFKVGDIYASNGFLNIHEGTGVAGLFGGDNQGFLAPRRWNGVIKYKIVNYDPSAEVDTCNEMLTTTYNDNLGSFGNMFDVVTRDSNVEVYGLNIYTDLYEPVSYEIYTRNDSFENGMIPSKAEMSILSGNSTNVNRMKLLNWTLVKKGDTVGSGYGKGTPIRGFNPFIIPPNSIQGFYVTLTTPDIRYRRMTDGSNARVGQMFFENDDFTINLGASVGTYPIADTFFEPRGWSGSFLYTVDHACDTDSPSMTPSTRPPTEIPSQFPSQQPSLGEFDGCTSNSTLKTVMSGATGSYGNMFTITAKDRISVISMDINVGTTDEIEVEIYTKLGEYNGFEGKREAWKLVADVKVTGMGDGIPTVIQDDDFEDIHMRPDERRSIYVTLSSPVIKYSRTRARLGEALFDDDMLSINVGAGLVAPAFVGGLFEPRKFNGALHYEYADDCATIIKTVFPFKFEIQYYSEINLPEVTEKINEIVTRELNSLLKNHDELVNLEKKYRFTFIDSITTALDSDCLESSGDGFCAAIESQATFSHKSTLERGKVQFILLNYVDYLSDKIKRDTVIQEAEISYMYNGDMAVESRMNIKLEGSFNEDLTEAETKYFESITEVYLSEKLKALGVTIYDVVVADDFNERRLQMNDDDSGGNSYGSIEIPTVIDGSYRPPPKIDFGGIIEDVINADGGDEYQDVLATGGREIPEEIKEQMGSFSSITGVSAETVREEVDTSTGEIPLKTILAGLLAGIALIFFVTLFWYLRKRKKESNSKRNLVKMESEYFDMKASQAILVDAKCVLEQANCTDVGFIQQIDDDILTRANTSDGNLSYNAGNTSFSTMGSRNHSFRLPQKDYGQYNNSMSSFTSFQR